MGERGYATPSDEPDHPRTVLVVEDEALIRMMISEYLRDCGFKIIEAGNAEEAIQILRTDVPVHAVFTDVHMPGSQDGFGLAQWVRCEQPGVKVMLTSGVTRTVQAAADLCHDADFLGKPYDPQEVEHRIRQLLAQQVRPEEG